MTKRALKNKTAGELFEDAIRQRLADLIPPYAEGYTTETAREVAATLRDVVSAYVDYREMSERQDGDS